MEPSVWTREAVLDFVGGKQILMRGPSGEQLEPPEWLAAGATEVNPLNSIESVEITHREDRGALIDSFVRARESPGVPSSTHIRVDFFGVWVHLDLVWLNLLEVPEVGGILGASEVVEGPPIEVTELDSGGTTQSTNWMILTLAEGGRIAAVRGRVSDVLGYDTDEILGRIPTDFIHPDHAPSAIENWVRLSERPDQTRTSRWRWCRKEGSEVWLESSYLVHDDETTEVVVVDVSERVANEEALVTSQREVAALAEDFRLLADEVPTAVFRCDMRGRVGFYNAHWEESFHGDGAVERVHELIDPDDQQQFDALLSELLTMSSPVSRSIEVRGAAGSRVLEISCRSVGGGVELGRFVGSVTDVTSAAVFRHQALHDSLTGVANRAMIEAFLEDAIRDDPDGTLVVFIDLDGFKAINDDHGHDAGDAVLVEVARRLSATVRPGDVVARYGGDEFVVVCRGVDAGGWAGVTERLESVFTEPVVFDGGSWSSAASLGTARPEPGVDAGTVLRRADQAMFEQKRSRKA